MSTLFTLLKAGCLALYALAIAAALGWLTGNLAFILQVGAVLMLALHLLEALVTRSQLQGLGVPPGRAFVMTLLFGLLYWKPLLDQRARMPALPQQPSP
jgi:hypothetical protein